MDFIAAICFRLFVVDFDEEYVLDDSVLDNLSPGSTNESRCNDIAEEDPLYPTKFHY